MPRRRAFDWVLVVVLTSVWAVLLARAIGEGLRTQRGQVRVHVSSAPAADLYPTVLGAGPWKQLAPGDRLEAVDGEDLRGSSALRFYDRVTRAARERGLVSVRVSRGGAHFDTHLGLTPEPWWWLILVTEPANLLAAILIVLLAPAWHLARRNLIAVGCICAMSAVLDWRSGIFGTAFEGLFLVALPLSTTLFMWNAQEFTRSARPVPWLHRSLAVAAWIAGTTHILVTYYVPFTDVAGRATLVAWRALGAAAIIGGMTRAYRRSDPLERRQIRWVVVGSAVPVVGAGFAMLTPGSSFDPLTHRILAATTRVVGAVSSLGFAVGILISVIGYRWLDIDRVISAATSYALLGLAILGSSFAVLPGLSQAAAPVVGVDRATLQWLLTMGLVLAAIPVHRYLWPRIDRRMFAERNRRMLGFARLLDEIGSYASAPELVRMAGERVDALLEPESIAVYARTEAHFTPVFARGRGMPTHSFDADSLLVRALEQRGRPLWADASELAPFDRAALETLGVELIVPIRGRNEVVAFACLGRKRSGDIYTPQEVAHLGAVANRCSEVLLRLTEPPPAVVSEPAAQVFRRDGELWTIASAGKEIRLRDMRGLHYLATLLREPGREFAATDLVKFASGMPLTRSAEDPALSVVSGLGDAGEVVDAQARAAYRERLREIETERAEAERNGDLGRLTRTSEEREALLAELVVAARGRRAASHAERARVAVTRAIRTALKKIAERHPELGDHLSSRIHRGYLCSYQPDSRTSASEWET